MKASSVFLLLSSSLLTTMLQAESQDLPVSLGRSYSIQEPDALAEIEARAAAIDWQKPLQEAVGKAYDKAPFGLPRSQANQIRHHVPWYTNRLNVTDKDGKVLYPSGYRFNPLEHLRLPTRLMFLDSQDLTWAQPLLKDSDMVILTGGKVSEASKTLGRPVFILDEELANRLGLQVTPTLVEQEGVTLRLQEFVVPAPS